MYSLSTLLRYGYFFCAAVPYLLFPPCSAMSTFSTLLRHIFSFRAAVLCLLFPRCCAMSTFSTRLLSYDPLSHDWQNYVLTRTVDIKPFLTNYYHVRWASQYPLIGLALFFFYFAHLSFQWANSETLIRRRALQRLIRLCTVRLCP